MRQCLPVARFGWPLLLSCWALNPRRSDVKAKDCLGKGSLLLCGGGFLFAPTETKYDAGEAIPGVVCPEALAEVEALYEEFVKDSSRDICRHLPTLLEYARRVRSVAEMGVNHGGSSLAFARAALEAAVLGGRDRYRYRMYDIVETDGMRKVSRLLKPCAQGVDFLPHVGDVLAPELAAGFGTEAPELLFLDTTHTYEQVSQELDAFGVWAQRYIILHDTETFGDSDSEVVFDEGTYRSHLRKQEVLRQQQRRLVLQHLEQGGSSTDEALSAVLAQAESEVRSHMRTGLRAAVRDWLAGPIAAGDWTVLEHSVVNNGLTVLARRSAMRSGGNQTEHCTEGGAGSILTEGRQLTKRLRKYSSSHPGMFGGGLTVDAKAARDMSRHLQSYLSLCPQDVGAKAALRVVLKHFSRSALSSMEDILRSYGQDLSATRSTAVALHSQAALHPVMFLVTVSDLEGSARVEHYEEAVQRWPGRVDMWYGLAQALDGEEASVGVPAARLRWSRNRAIHAWRRVLALRGRNRVLAASAVQRLQDYAAWEEMTAGDAEVQRRVRLWDDPRRSPMHLWLPALADRAAAFPDVSSFQKHPQFEFASELVQQRWSALRAELLQVVETRSASQVGGWCKDSGWCEYQLLAFEGCLFRAECLLAPNLCNTLRDLESGGLRLVRAAMSVVGSWEAKQSKVHIKPHASLAAGRLRLSCTLLVSEGTTSTMYIAGETPLVYEEGRCFWFDETFTHEVIHEAKGSETYRATFYLDALHPAYYGEHTLEESHAPGSLGDWQALVEEALTPADNNVGLHLLRAEPHTNTYRVEDPGQRKWVELATQIQTTDVNVCILGDDGGLFHKVAFKIGDPATTSVLLGLFTLVRQFIRNAKFLEEQGASRRDLTGLLRRFQSVTVGELEMLRFAAWRCAAVGCSLCPVAEITGLCTEGFSEVVRGQMLESFAQMLRSEGWQARGWFSLLGWGPVPPLGWQMDDATVQSIIDSKQEEVRRLGLV